MVKPLLGSKSTKTSLNKKCNAAKIVLDVEKGCREECIKKIALSSIKSKRTNYWGRNLNDRKAFLDNAIASSHSIETSHQGRRPSVKRFMIDGVPCCIHAWCMIYGITFSWYVDR